MELEKKTNFKTCTTLQFLIARILNQSLNHMTREKDRTKPLKVTPGGKMISEATWQGDIIKTIGAKAGG